MRELKFKAWDKILKYMVHSEYGYWVSFDGVAYKESDKKHNTPNIEITKLRDVILLQYTGLKDKNGVEIYEGDVVKIETFNPQIYQVGFDRGGFCFYNEGDSYYHDVKYLDKCTVIGNIFQNPELLEVGK